MEYKYDIALSFTGEDRKFVDEIAEILKANSVKVFYDKFETVDLWGKDLGIHFEYVYRKSAKYCVPFISKFYKEKIWTNYEIRNAISRAIENNEEYILPVRFDDTELDGLRPTLGFIDLKNLTPEELAKMILTKLENEPAMPIAQKEQPESRIYLSSNVHISEYDGITGFSIFVDVVNTVKEPRYFNQPLFKLSPNSALL